MKILTILIALVGLLLAACQPFAHAQSKTDSPATLSAGVDTATTRPPEDISPPLSSLFTTTPILPPAQTPFEEIATEATLMPTLESIPPEAEPLIQLSIQYLVKRFNLSADQIFVSQVTPVTWRDASLGCPKPGIDYIQVETPGYNILLEAGGVTYNIHTDLKDRIVQCASRPPGDIFMPP